MSTHVKEGVSGYKMLSPNVKPSWQGCAGNSKCKARNHPSCEAEVLPIKWFKQNKLKLAGGWVVKPVELLNWLCLKWWISWPISFHGKQWIWVVHQRTSCKSGAVGAGEQGRSPGPCGETSQETAWEQRGSFGLNKAKHTDPNGKTEQTSGQVRPARAVCWNGDSDIPCAALSTCPDLFSASVYREAQVLCVKYFTTWGQIRGRIN